MISIILGSMNALSLSLFDNDFIHWKISIRIYSFSGEDNLLFKYENSAMKIFKFFSVLERQGRYVRLNRTVHTYKIRGTRMDKSV